MNRRLFCQSAHSFRRIRHDQEEEYEPSLLFANPHTAFGVYRRVYARAMSSVLRVEDFPEPAQALAREFDTNGT